MDLIILKILKQLSLVLQRRLHLGQIHISDHEIESTGENIQTSHATEISTAESSKHYLR